MSDQRLNEIEKLLAETIARKANHVLLVPHEPPVFHTAGRLCRSELTPLTPQEITRMATAALGEDRLARIGPDWAMAEACVTLPDGSHAAVCVTRSGGQPSITLRPVGGMDFTVTQLRIPEVIVRACESPDGLVLVTGRPGSGKTTTAYALLEHINRTRDVQIAIIEYAPNYVLESKRAVIQHRIVGQDAPDMPSAIAAAIYQGANVLFIGEIRDLDVLERCLNAAELLGMLVITQLHQPTPQAAIERMIALQTEQDRPLFRKTLAKALQGVIAQCLLSQSGSDRRIAAYGTLVPDAAMRLAIAQGEPLERTPLPEGCRSLADDICQLRDQGLATPESAAKALESLKVLTP